MKLERNKDPNSIWNNLGKLLLIILAGSLIYSLPYFRYYYYDAFVETFNVNNTQLGLLGSAFGFAGVISYFLGGLIADRFSVKNLMAFSLITTGLGGFVLLSHPPYSVVFAVHMYWGISSLLTFWPAVIKAIRMLGTESEQSKAYGFFEGGRGLSNAVYMAIVLALFGAVAAKSGNKAGITTIIITYSLVDIILGSVIFFIFKEKKSESISQTEEKGKKFDFGIFKQVISMKYTWMIIIIMFCSYSMNMSFYYFTPYATSQFGSTAVFAAAISILAQWVRPIGCVGAGVLGDKIGSSKVMAIGFVLMATGLVGALIIPTEASMITGLIVSCVAIFISMYAMQSMHYALLEEGGYSVAVSGMTVGILATIGYLPELVMPIIAGRLLDSFPGITGYRYLFTYLLGLALIGLTVTLFWLKLTKVRRKEIREIALKRKEESKELAC